MVWEATIAIGKLVGYFYILFVVVLIAMIIIAGLVKILAWLTKDY